MFQKITALPGAVLDFFLKTIRKYPWHIVAGVWVLAISAAARWRLGRPFDENQPTLIGLGAISLVVGLFNLMVEQKKEPINLRVIVLCSYVVIVGLILSAMGLRIP